VATAPPIESGRAMLSRSSWSHFLKSKELVHSKRRTSPCALHAATLQPCTGGEKHTSTMATDGSHDREARRDQLGKETPTPPIRLPDFFPLALLDGVHMASVPSSEQLARSCPCSR
jgi:hypothetical protein